MISLRPFEPRDAADTIAVWRRAVDATHDFLTVEDRAAIDAEVCDFLPQAPLILAIDGNDRPVGFMLVMDGHMEALFIDPAWRGQGVGRTLVEAALKDNPGMTTDVNEQNGQAAHFYARMGFAQTGRSERDGQGRPYPLLHLRHRSG